MVKKIYIGDYDELAIIPIEGGFFVSGTTKATADDPGDMIWAKLDRNLTQLYGKILEGVREESIVFEPTDDGGWIGSGSTNSYGPEGDRDILILKIDSSGNVQWGKVFNHGPGDDSATILEVPDGYMLCGSVVNATSGGQDILVAKLNHSGVPQWAKLYGGTGISAAVMRKISEGDFLLYGTTKASPTSYDSDIILIKIDSSGNILWAKKYASDNAEFLNNVIENPDGTFLLSGTVTDFYSFRYYILLMKVDSSGRIVWQKALSGTGFDVGALWRSSDGNYMLAGQTASLGPSGYDEDIFFAKLNSLEPLTFVWQRRFGGSGMDTGGVTELQNGYLITGTTSSFGASDANVDLFGIILDSDGNYPGCYINPDFAFSFDRGRNRREFTV